MWQKERHVTFVVYLLSLIRILPLIPSFFLPPTPHFLIPNSSMYICSKTKHYLSCYDVTGAAVSAGWAKLRCSNKQPPLLKVSKQQRSVCYSCCSSSSLAWQRVLFSQGSRPVDWCYMKTYHPWWVRGKGSSDPKGGIPVSSHSSEWVTGVCPITGGSGNVFLPRT